MNSQEIFDTVVNHLRQQGKRATNADGICMYRTTDGLKCAAGILIPDGEYSPDMERKGVSTLLYKRMAPQLAATIEGDESLVSLLQYTHDILDPKEWEGQFRSLANQFNLVYTPKSEPEDMTPPQA